MMAMKPENREQEIWRWDDEPSMLFSSFFFLFFFFAAIFFSGVLEPYGFRLKGIGFRVLGLGIWVVHFGVLVGIGLDLVRVDGGEF